MGSFSRKVRVSRKKEDFVSSPSGMSRDAASEKYGSGVVEAYERENGMIGTESSMQQFSEKVVDKRDSYFSNKRQNIFGNIGSSLGN